MIEHLIEIIVFGFTMYLILWQEYYIPMKREIHSLELRINVCIAALETLKEGILDPESKIFGDLELIEETFNTIGYDQEIRA